jgi:DNA repair photolyase
MRIGGGGPAAPALFERGAVARSFDTPGFAGMTFFEVHARSVINRVPEASRVPFRWTINPYRGCSHACSYCFARQTHTYLDLDSGQDFNSKIVVKVNAPQRVRAELAAPRWRGEHIAMGTNVDCYQRAEGRYQLMPGILAALRDAANPFSILTKGTLILRDLGLLEEASQVTDVGLAVSVGCTDHDLWRTMEPGTPSPRRRLEVCATFSSRGLPCGVLMGPVVPFLSDSPAQLAATVRQAAQAGASSVSPIVLHLRPGAREWFFGWLGEHHPGLVPRYRALYGRGAYAPKAYQQQVSEQVRDLARHEGIGRASHRRRTGADQPRPGPGTGQRWRAGRARGTGADRGDSDGQLAGDPVQLSLL